METCLQKYKKKKKKEKTDQNLTYPGFFILLARALPAGRQLCRQGQSRQCRSGGRGCLWLFRLGDTQGGCPALRGGMFLPGEQKRAVYVKWNQATKSWRSCLLSPARAIKCGIKEETAPRLIGPIQEGLVPKFFYRSGFYSEPQLISPATQRGFRGLIKTR